MYYAQSCLTFCSPTICSPPCMEFSRQEYWSKFPFPTPGDSPDPGTKLTSPGSLALSAGFFTTNTTWEAQSWRYNVGISSRNAGVQTFRVSELIQRDCVKKE